MKAVGKDSITTISINKKKAIMEGIESAIGAIFGFLTAVVLVIALYYLAVGKLVKGLRSFGRLAAQWKSDDEAKVNVMKSLAQVSDGLANFILFIVIAPLIVAFVVALAS